MRLGGQRAANAMTGLVAACALLSGCAGRPAPTPLPRPSLTAVASAGLPLQAYRHDLDGERLVFEARNILVAACMARAGHPDWRPPDPPGERPWESGMSIGLLDAAHAARFGYRAPPDSRAMDEESVPDDERLAYLGPMPGESAPGVPEGGCVAEADRAFGPPPDLSLVASLGATAEDAVATDPRAIEALTAWSDCMAESGYEYERPGEAQFQYWPQAVTAAEKDLASADVACKTDSGLGDVWAGLLSGYQAELVERNRAELDAVAAALAAELDRARAVVGEER